jgi:hypothetical protein
MTVAQKKFWNLSKARIIKLGASEQVVQMLIESNKQFLTKVIYQKHGKIKI